MGLALIKQSQSLTQQQFYTNLSEGRPRHDLLNQSPKRPPARTHCLTTNQPMIQPRVNHQVTKQIHIWSMLPDQARPLMDVQQDLIPEPADSPSLRRPAGESFDYSDGKQHRATK